MSYLFDGANDRLTGTFASTYADPVTIAVHLKATVHPVTTDYLIQLGNSATIVDDAHGLRTGTTDNQWQAESRTAAGAASVATVTLDIDGVWAGYVGVFSSNTLRDCYVQSFANSGTNATSRIVGDLLQHIQVGETLADAQDFTGRIAEVAIWNKALTQAEITAYMDGDAASSIAAANLIGYWPLDAANATQANEGLDAGGDLTVSGATFDADHPTITSGGVTGTIVGATSLTAALAGTHVPPVFAGTIAVTLENTIPALIGSGDVRFGDVVVVFDEMTADLVGSHTVSGAVTGNIAGVLDPLTADVQASTATFIQLDVNINIGVNWTLTDFTIDTGTVDADLADLTSLLTGSFQILDQRNGTIAVTLGDVVPVLTGTVVNPGAFVGVITSELAAVAAQISGNIFAAANNQGTIQITFDDVDPQLVGAVVAPAFTGTIATVLEDGVSLWQAQFIAAGSFFGPIQAQLDDVAAALVGTFTVPARTGTIVATFDDLACSLGGLFIPLGGNIGVFNAVFDDCAALLNGSVTSPTVSAPIDAPVGVTSIDWKTLTDQYNVGQSEPEVEYEFSGGRQFFRKAS